MSSGPSSDSPNDPLRLPRESRLAAQLVDCIPSLRRWAHRRLPRWARGVADTTDLIQDALLRTLRRRDAIELQTEHALAAYLRACVRNRILDEHRRIARHGTTCPLPDRAADSGPSPFDRAVAAEAEARYREALGRVSAAERELIVAHVELGYTHEQLACMTGRSPNAARMAIHRALVRLAARMRDRWR